MIILREMQASDRDAVIFIHTKSIYGMCKDYYTQKEMEAWTSRLTPKLFDEGIKDENNVGVVAVDSDSVIGYGFFNVKDREVRALYIMPGFTRQGAGRRMLARLEELAKERKIEKLTAASTLNAVGFYKKLGYREIGEEKHPVGESISVACVRMQKSIDEIV